jgi:hypothetical protein
VLQQFSFSAACHLFISAKYDMRFFVVVFAINIYMQIQEVVTTPKTPEQQRIASLAANKDRAADALAAERQRQKVAKAQQALSAARQARSASNVP